MKYSFRVIYQLDSICEVSRIGLAITNTYWSEISVQRYELIAILRAKVALKDFCFGCFFDKRRRFQQN